MLLQESYKSSLGDTILPMGVKIGAEFLRLNPLQDCRPAYVAVPHNITGGQPSIVIHYI